MNKQIKQPHPSWTGGRVPSGKPTRKEMAARLRIPNTPENAAKLDFFIAELPGSNYICHQSCTFHPDGSVEWHKPNWPVGRVKPRHRYDCKYCHTTHADWYQMDPADYSLGEPEPIDVILCGNCGHTSRKEFATVSREPKN